MMMPFDSYVPTSSSRRPRRSTPSRAVLTYGSTIVMMSSSPNPPGVSSTYPSSPGSPTAGLSATSGSAASTRGLTAIVSVALIATLCSFTPASASTPRFGTTFGTML